MPPVAPPGACPACILLVALAQDTRPPPASSAGENVTFGFEPVQPGHVLESLARSIGWIHRVLLPENAPDGTGLAIAKPSSDQCRGRGRGAGRPLPAFRRIARGGCRALKGRDPDLGRDRAVKVLAGEPRRQARQTARFVEEAQMAGNCSIPDRAGDELGVFADRRPFFTMKLVKGRTWRRCWRNGS